MNLNIFSVPGLIAWLEGQDPETEYEWVSTQNCLAARYLRARTGVKQPSTEFSFLKVFGDTDSYDRIAYSLPHTYGAALARAKETVGAA